MYLWDTNLLVAYQTGHPILHQHVARVPWDEIGLPSVVVAEAMRGRCDYHLKATPEQVPVASQRLIETYDLLKQFKVVEFNKKAAQALIVLKRTRKSKKRYADMLIAAMAIADNHIVVTRNVRHFKDLLPARQLVNWIDNRP